MNIEASAHEEARLRALLQLEQLGLEWVPIPAGEFTMGSNEYAEEKPIHRVHLSAYQIARHLVTNAQDAAFVEATWHAAPQHWKGGKIPHGKKTPCGECVVGGRAGILCVGGRMPAHRGGVGEGGARDGRADVPVGEPAADASAVQ